MFDIFQLVFSIFHGFFFKFLTWFFSPNNFQKTCFLTLKIVKMTLSEGQNLTWKLNFRGHLSTFRAENRAESGPFKALNNAQTTSEQIQTNFQKPQKTDFF